MNKLLCTFKCHLDVLSRIQYYAMVLRTDHLDVRLGDDIFCALQIPGVLCTNQSHTPARHLYMNDKLPILSDSTFGIYL